MRRTLNRIFAGLALSALLFNASASFAGSADLSWSPTTTNTDGSAIADLAGYRVYYGTASGAYSQKISVGNVTSYTVPNLTDGATYYFAVTAINNSGIESGYSNEASKKTPAPDTTAPVITGVYSGNVSTSAADVSWVTDEASDSQVEYGMTTGYGYKMPLDASMVLSHKQTVSGLAPSTTYNYRVLSRDAAGNLGASANFTFTTKAVPDTTPPVISSVLASDIAATSVRIQWNTDEPATTGGDYGTSASYGSAMLSDTVMTSVHSVTLTGLSSNTTYDYRVVSKDGSGNQAVSQNFTFRTSNIAPVISSFKASSVSGNAPFQVNFTAAASDKDGTIASYEWDFDGDKTYADSTGAVAAASHTYSKVGTYSATVRVKDDGGAVVTSDPVTITVSSSSHVPPVVNKIINSTTAGEPSDLYQSFDVDLKVPAGSKIVKYEWDFDGNGKVDATTTSTPAGYTYPAPGTYSPVVTVTDDQGAVAKGMTTLTVTGAATDAPAAPAPSASSSGGSAGGCFIATAAYGSYLEPQVMVLREFRDHVLMTNWAGREFVDLYYRVSPPIADYIARHSAVKLAVRLMLTPVVFGIKYPILTVFVALVLTALALSMLLMRRPRF